MFNLILLVIVALSFGYFSTQNTLTIPLTFGPYTLTGTPLFLVIGIALLLGLLLAWITHSLSSLSTALNLREQAKIIGEQEANLHALTKRVNELQLENATLKGELKHEPSDELAL